MPPVITLEAIEAKHNELSLLIAQFKEQPVQTTHHVFPEIDIELQPGELYAGPVLDASGHLMHHLVVMAHRPTDDLAWQAAMDWAAHIGGVLPTRQELSLIFANCKPHLKPKWHWSSDVYEKDASYAWHCYFAGGAVSLYHKSYEGSVVAVRRV